MSALVCASVLDQWEPVDDINLGNLLRNKLHINVPFLKDQEPRKWLPLKHDSCMIPSWLTSFHVFLW